MKKIIKHDLTKSHEIVKRDKEIYGQFGRIPYFPLVVKKIYGSTVEDVDGNKYIDIFGASSTANTGFNNERIIEAVKRQMDECINYTAAYSYSEKSVELAEELVKLTPGNFRKKVFFGLTGSDINELMMKLARAYTKKSKIIAFKGSFHGCSYGSGAMTAIAPSMKDGTGSFDSNVEHIQYATCYRCPYDKDVDNCNIDCLKELEVSLASYLPINEVAAVVLEPVLGDGGLFPPPKKFIQALYKFCTDNGILFCVDEVQQGLGRAGKWCAIENYDVVPDIVVLGKSLGGGFPLSAAIAKSEIIDSLGIPAHGSSLYAHTVSVTAAMESINIIKDEKLLDRSIELGNYAKERFEKMQEKFDFIGDVRGIGLNIGVDLVKDRNTKEPDVNGSMKICYSCFERGVLLVFVSNSVLRIQPNLTISFEELKNGLDIIEETMQDYKDGNISDEVLAKIQGW